MTNKERLEVNNRKIEEITRALAKKQVSPTDMLQQMVNETHSCNNLFYKYQGSNLDFVKNLDTSKATSMLEMFARCQYLTSLDLSSFDTSNVKSMSSMFYLCDNLTSLDLSSFDTSKLTDISGMFSSCKKLISVNLSGFNTENVQTMTYLFEDCKKLTSVDLSNFNTKKVTGMSRMFYGCGALTSVNLSNFDTSNVKSMGNMFYNCSLLESIIGKLDLISVTDTSSMFGYCTNLTNLTLKNIKKSLYIGGGTSYGTKLTNESLINTFKELWDLTGSTSQTLTLSTTSKNNIANIYVKLIDVTDEMLAQDQYAGNKKPCVVCEPTDEGAMTLTEYATSKGWAIS